MARSKVNSDITLSEMLLELKRHMMKCKECEYAKKSQQPYDMCEFGMLEVVRVATLYDNLIDMRLKMRDIPANAVIPCPNPMAHGKTYTLTATPVLVTGFLAPLF